jgi:hypothetical protein
MSFRRGQMVRIQHTRIVFEVFAVSGDTIQAVDSGRWYVAGFCVPARRMPACGFVAFVDGPVMP